MPSDRQSTEAPAELDGAGDGYAPAEEERPLAGYTVLSSAFVATLAGSLILAERSGRTLPERIPVTDIVLAGIATHKVSRLVTKDKVTSFVRAPFTRYEGRAGYGQLDETARGTGIQRAIGELLTCPYCIGQWVSGAFVVGYVAAPRTTRLMAAMWSAHALADAAQLAYSAASKRV